MPERETDLIILELPCDPHAPARVREALGQALHLGWVVGDAMLVVSELVTNAVLHSGGSQGDVVEVCVSMRPGCVRISVRDPGFSGLDARPRPSQTLGGWGLRIVEQLAQQWGSDRTDSYQVWAEIALQENDLQH